MSTEQITEKVVEFVPLLGFENDYEILNDYPFTIRRKKDHYEVKEILFNTGYIYVNLHGHPYRKHILIAKQFITNDDPEHKTQVDHKNKNRGDYHLSNLRWVTPSTNQKNKSSHMGVNYQYVDEIDENAIVVDSYMTKNGRHEFKDYYYHNGVFYYDNDMNYRILYINTLKNGCQYVRMNDINGITVSVYINRFLQQHDLK